MSLDMVVMAVPGTAFPRAIVERAFATYVKDVKDDEWYPCPPGEEQSAVYMTVDVEEMIDGFSINRPPFYDGFPGFWDAVFEVMQQTRSCCLIAGVSSRPNICVAREDIVNEDMIEFAGGRDHVRVVSSGAELEAAAYG